MPIEVLFPGSVCCSLQEVSEYFSRWFTVSPNVDSSVSELPEADKRALVKYNASSRWALGRGTFEGNAINSHNISKHCKERAHRPTEILNSTMLKKLVLLSKCSYL